MSVEVWHIFACATGIITWLVIFRGLRRSLLQRRRLNAELQSLRSALVSSTSAPEAIESRDATAS